MQECTVAPDTLAGNEGDSKKRKEPSYITYMIDF
jgi:hypothetical protein